jgi:hypothetical protein
MYDEFVSILAPYDPETANELQYMMYRYPRKADQWKEQLVEELYKHDELSADAAAKEFGQEG